MKKQEKWSHEKTFSGLARKRQLASKQGHGSAYKISQPSLNLSQDEYEKKLEELKKMGYSG